MFIGPTEVLNFRWGTLQVSSLLTGNALHWQHSGASAGTSSLLIKFEDSSGGTLPHRITSSPPGSELQPVSLAVGDTEHALIGLEWNTLYAVSLAAVGESALSPALTASIWTAPSAYPTGFAATPNSPNSALLTWNLLAEEPASVGGGYEVEISDDGIAFDFPTIVVSGTSTLEWVGLLDATEYFFRLRAVNVNTAPHDNGVSAWSPIISATTDPASTFYFTSSPVIGPNVVAPPFEFLSDPVIEPV